MWNALQPQSVNYFWRKHSKNQHYKSGCEVYEGEAGAVESIVDYLLMKKSSLLHISIPPQSDFNITSPAVSALNTPVTISPMRWISHNKKEVNVQLVFILVFIFTISNLIVLPIG